MLFLPRIQHFDCHCYSALLSTALLLSLISTAVVVEAQETINGEHWPVQYQEQEATSELRSEEDVGNRHSQETSESRNEEKHESTGSGFVANALAAGVGTLLASGIANYGSYGYPYTSGGGFNNMAGAYAPGAYVSGTGAYMPGVGVYPPGSYIPGAGGYIPASYVPGAGAYIPMVNSPNYGVMSSGYRPPQSLPIYGDRDDSDHPADDSTDLADFANSYPGYYSELVGGNTSPKKENEANVAASALSVDTDGDSSVAEQQDIRTAGSSVQFPIEWSTVANDYYRSIGLDSNSRLTEAESEDMATIYDHSYSLDFQESY